MTLSQPYRHLIPADLIPASLLLGEKKKKIQTGSDPGCRSWLQPAIWGQGPPWLVAPLATFQQRESEMQSSSGGTRARGVPHKPGPGFICTGTPAVPLPVKPLCQRNPRNVTGSVTLSAPRRGSAGCSPRVARTEPSSEQEEEEEGRK